MQLGSMEVLSRHRGGLARAPRTDPVQTYSGGRKYLKGSAPDGGSVALRFQIHSGNP